MLYSALADLLVFGVANFVIWSIIAYLLAESASPLFLNVATKAFVIILPLFLLDSLYDSWLAHDYLIDVTGLPYNKIILKTSILITATASVITHWKSSS
jgi:hypothetical protein